MKYSHAFMVAKLNGKQLPAAIPYWYNPGGLWKRNIWIKANWKLESAKCLTKCGYSLDGKAQRWELTSCWRQVTRKNFTGKGLTQTQNEVWHAFTWDYIKRAVSSTMAWIKNQSFRKQNKKQRQKPKKTWPLQMYTIIFSCNAVFRVF